MSYVWLNGDFVDESTASVSVRDTGLLHGVGVFTTLRGYGSKLFRLDRHLQRLRKSCDTLAIPLRYSDQVMTSAVRDVLERNKLADARLRLTITRGSTRQDPKQGLRLEPTVLVSATHLDPYPAQFYQRGITVILLEDQKANPYDVQAGHKTLNYLSRLTALRVASQQSAGEALWFSVHNHLQSGCISNVFIVKAHTLITPPTPADLQNPIVAAASADPRSAVLPGITRETVIELAQEAGIPVKMESIDVNRLLEAEEVFLTNSIMQIMPVCRIERSVVADDKPGPITRELTAAYSAAVANEAL